MSNDKGYNLTNLSLEMAGSRPVLRLSWSSVIITLTEYEGAYQNFCMCKQKAANLRTTRVTMKKYTITLKNNY
jgi:hypothetical protein